MITDFWTQMLRPYNACNYVITSNLILFLSDFNKNVRARVPRSPP